MEIRPQEGPQETFLSTSADIAIYGGAAGGGKTFALLLENIRHINNPLFGAVIFRRNATQITNEGGLWDNALSLYPYLGAIPKQSPKLCMVFPSGAKVSFSHLQLERDVNSWQGAQIALICFDELCHFTEKQFFYMLSRNRSLCGIKPYIRATCNPDADSWVASFIDWWIGKDGYPIPERSGVIRYFIRIDGRIIWGNSREELIDNYNLKKDITKSATFISSSIFDNKILLEADPGYFASLNALSTVDKERLLKGNWKIRPASGLYFKRTQVKEVVANIPGNVVRWVRAWDMAGTEPTEGNKDPDATAGVLIGKLADGNFIIADCKRSQIASSEVRKLIKNTATIDNSMYDNVRIRLSQDPGQAGKEQAKSYSTFLSGFSVSIKVESGNKIVRAEPLVSQWQQGNIYILAGAWNDMFFDEMESFPEGAHDDIVDAAANAFNELNIVAANPAKVRARSI